MKWQGLSHSTDLRWLSSASSRYARLLISKVEKGLTSFLMATRSPLRLSSAEHTSPKPPVGIRHITHTKQQTLANGPQVSVPLRHVPWRPSRRRVLYELLPTIMAHVHGGGSNLHGWRGGGYENNSVLKSPRFGMISDPKKDCRLRL